MSVKCIRHTGIVCPPRVSPTGRFKIAYRHDPAGVSLELVEVASTTAPSH